MKLRLSTLLPAVIALCASPAVLAQGSAEQGQVIAAPCVACHGVDGNSVNPEWPSLAGQHPQYIVRQLELFKSGVRENVLMTPMAQPLSEEDMYDLAAYYAAQQPKGLEADPSFVELGRRIYQAGIVDQGVAACAACHGPAGKGNPAAVYPKIAGQHAAYVASQLRAYKTGTRDSDPNQMMREVASRLTEEEILAVSSYVQGLR